MLRCEDLEELKKRNLDTEKLARTWGVRTFATVAASTNDVDMLRYLHERGVNLLSGGENLGTPLFKDVARGHCEAVTFLMELGADPRIPEKNRPRYSPLHEAILRHHVCLLRKICDYNPEYIPPCIWQVEN